MRRCERPLEAVLPKVRGFLVERGMEGLATPRIEGKFSLRASPTAGDLQSLLLRELRA